MSKKPSIAGCEVVQHGDLRLKTYVCGSAGPNGLNHLRCIMRTYYEPMHSTGDYGVAAVFGYVPDGKEELVDGADVHIYRREKEGALHAGNNPIIRVFSFEKATRVNVNDNESMCAFESGEIFGPEAALLRKLDGDFEEYMGVWARRVPAIKGE